MKAVATIAVSLTAIGLTTVPAAARDERSRRTRALLGPQLTPGFSGADQASVRPFIDVSRVRGDDVFAFGPAIGFAGRRGRRDVRPGLDTVGVTAGALRQMGPRRGPMVYARYDRLVSDAARSSIVRADGSRNQLSGGPALMWTFGPLPGGR